MTRQGTLLSRGNVLMGAIFLTLAAAFVFFVPNSPNKKQTSPNISVATVSLPVHANSIDSNATQAASIPASEIATPETNSGEPSSLTTNDPKTTLDIPTSLTFPATFGQSSTTPDLDKPAMIRFFDWLALCQGSISIDGHTDNIGTERENKVIGRNRASKIKDIIISKGISSHRISVVSSGSSEPLQSNDTAEGQAANRRVIVTCIK